MSSAFIARLSKSLIGPQMELFKKEICSSQEAGNSTSLVLAPKIKPTHSASGKKYTLAAVMNIN